MTVEGHIENGQIVLNQPISLPEGTRVRVELLAESESPQQAASPPSTLYDRYKSVIGVIQDLPADFAAQHDHYIHGTPKK